MKKTSLVFFIVISFLVKSLISSTTLYHNFDETIITQISSLPLTQLINTITHEPHPPLFYLIIKLISLTHLPLCFSLSLINFFIVFLTLYHQVTNKHHKALTITVLIFTSTFSYLLTSTQIKPQIISTPLLLYSLTLTISIHQSQSIRVKHLFLKSTFILLTLFFINYLDFLYAFLAFFIISIQKYPQRSLTTTLNLLFPTTLYLLTFGHLQLTNNQNRFHWVNYYHNHPLTSLTTSLFGTLHPLFYLATSLLIGIFLVFFITTKKISTNTKTIPIIWFVLAFVTKSFTRIRYIPHLTLSLCASVSWHLSSLPPIKIFSLLIPFNIFTLTMFYQYTQHQNNSMTSLIHSLNTHSSNQPTVLITNRALFAYTLYQEKILPKNFIPTNLSSDANFTTPISARHLQLDAKVLSSQDQIINQLKHQSTKGIVYIHVIQPNPGFYDPQQLIPQTLNHYCQKTTTSSLDTFIITFYTQCHFH